MLPRKRDLRPILAKSLRIWHIEKTSNGDEDYPVADVPAVAPEI